MASQQQHNNRIIFSFYFIAALIFTFFLWSQDGNPFRYDWDWPIFNMKEFWTGLSINSQVAGGLIAAVSRNATLLFGLPGLINVPPAWCLKFFIVIIHTAAGYGFYLLVSSRIKNKLVAIAGGLFYAFTPYVFIRTIVGFIFSLLAYAVLPYFLNLYLITKKQTWQYAIPGLLLSLIFAQVQAGLLTLLFIGLYSTISSIANRDYKLQLKNFFSTLFFWILSAMPWIIMVLAKSKDNSFPPANGHEATTLSFIASLPHSLRMMLMTTDHHITYEYFAPLAHNRFVVAGYLLFYIVGLCALFAKINRKLVLTAIITLVVILPFFTGPIGHFGSFYTWVYDHFPPIAIFRETYHFQFIIAFVAVLLFTLGSDVLYSFIGRYIKVKTLAVCTKIIILLSAVPLIYQYFTFNYAGYLSLQPPPKPYYALNQYLKNNPSTCQKIYYPPGLGFISFTNDKLASRGASNSDLFASAIGLPYLDQGASVLNFAKDDTYYRNEVISQFYEKDDGGEFVHLLNEGSIDCVVARTDIVTQYHNASNLGREQDSTIKEKWLNTDYLGLIIAKKGLKEIVNFDNTIYIFKPGSDTQSSIINTNNVVESLPNTQNLIPKIYLPLTSWANNYFYYKDGWSRGRYDFWRKHLFTRLRQDFIYTDKTGTVLSGNISERGKYELWVRYLTGGTTGEVKLRIIRLGDNSESRQENYELRMQKEAGEEKFIWNKLGDIELDGKASVEITNIIGENAIADIALVQSST